MIGMDPVDFVFVGTDPGGEPLAVFESLVDADRWVDRMNENGYFDYDHHLVPIYRKQS